jgi:hypothetical protein
MGIPELLTVGYWLLLLVVPIWPTARICRRMGFSPWLAALVIVPVGNLVLLWFLAYAPWPAEAGRRAP